MSSVADQHGACFVLEGRTFVSLDELECGLTPNGPALCHWQVMFKTFTPDDSLFQWSHSDVGESGAVTCEGADLQLRGNTTSLTVGVFDATAQLLTWHEVVYAP